MPVSDDTLNLNGFIGYDIKNSGDDLTIDFFLVLSLSRG